MTSGAPDDGVRAQLLAALADNTEQLRALERTHREVVEAAAGSNLDDEHDPEGSTIAFERAQVAVLMASARAGRERLEAALERLDRGQHGMCEVCAAPIAPGRLAARPDARTCITCAGAASPARGPDGWRRR